MYKSFTALMALGMVAAAPSSIMSSPRQDAPARKLLISTPAQIFTADFTGSNFQITGKYSQVGTGPSWLLYKEPNLVYAVDENSDALNLFKLNPSGPQLEATVSGTTGVVSLAFNGEKTRLVAASYGTGSYDVWDIQANNNLKMFKNIPLEGKLGPKPVQSQHRAHQALLDPTDRYFVIPDLGGDSLAVVDSEYNSYAVVNTVDVGAGTGPRHGGFVSIDGGDQATHYIVACELSNELVLYQLTYGEGTIDFAETDRKSTYGAAFPPANATSAAAGELIVSSNGHVYVSNRLSGNETDSIAHFALQADAQGVAELRFVDTVSSSGLVPRMFSLSKDADQSIVFVANQDGAHGVAAFRRDATTGSIEAAPFASIPLADLVAPEFAGQQNVGPVFIQEI